MVDGVVGLLGGLRFRRLRGDQDEQGDGGYGHGG